MKKRLSAIILSAVMGLLICACGGGAKTAETTTTAAEETTTAEEMKTTEEASDIPSKEELMKDPVKTTILDLQNALYDNKVKAKQTYCNVPVLVTGKALMVEDDHVVILDSQVGLDAFLSIDDLVKIETGKNISVIGIISDIQDIEMDWGGQKYTSPHYIMDIAYLVD